MNDRFRSFASWWRSIPRSTCASVTNISDAAIETYCQAPFRLPTPNELLTLVDPTREKPSIDVNAFPGTPSVAFFAVDNDRGRAVDFSTRNLGSTSAAGKVRCVR